MELLKVMRGNLAAESNCNAAEEILSLIKSGYDVNAVTELGVTALHFAISRNMPDVAQTLIDHGADINLPQDHSESTPLQLAVRFRNRELVCMLLCYGADVTAVDCYKMTPLMTALNMGENEIARILFDYYDDFTQVNGEGYNCVWYAAKMKNPIAIDLLNSNRCVSKFHSNVIIFSLLYNDSQFFNLLWSNDYNIIIEMDVPFLLHFLRLCQFNKTDWVDCLYNILSCSLSMELVNQYQAYIDLNQVKTISFFWILYRTFYGLEVPLNDRLKIVSLCLSLGMKPNFKDLSFVYSFYKFTDELEILIQAGGSFPYPTSLGNVNELLMLHILGKEHQKQIDQDKLISDCLKRDLAGWAHDMSIINFLKYVFVNINVKNSLHMICSRSEHAPEVRVLIEAIKNSPSCPSLLNLARNTIRSYLCTRTPDEVAYHYFDKVNRLSLPKMLKNLICFREPVYRHN